VSQQPLVPDEQAELAQAAREAQRLSPSERVALFVSIMQTIENIWASLPPEERWRRIVIGEEIDDPAPRPWWLGVRPDARPQLPDPIG